MSAGLPPGWEEKISRTTGVTYYFNTQDGTCTWIRPDNPPLSKSVAPDLRPSSSDSIVEKSAAVTKYAYNTPPARAPAAFLLPRPVQDDAQADEEARKEVSRNITDIVGSSADREIPSMSHSKTKTLASPPTANTSPQQQKHDGVQPQTRPLGAEQEGSSASRLPRSPNTETLGSGNGIEQMQPTSPPPIPGAFDVVIPRGANGGLGLVFNREDPAGGPYRVTNMLLGGTAAVTHRVFVDDIIHRVQGVSVQDKDVDQVKALILGTPGSDVALTITRSSPKPDTSSLQTSPISGRHLNLSKLEASKEGIYGVGLKFISRDENVEVLQVKEGGPAEAAGVCAGDLIVAVDDVPVNVAESGANIASLLLGPESSMVKIMVRRREETGGYKTLDFFIPRRPVEIKSPRGKTPRSKSATTSPRPLDVAAASPPPAAAARPVSFGGIEVFPAFPDDERRPVSMPVDAEASIDAARALAGRREEDEFPDEAAADGVRVSIAPPSARFTSAPSARGLSGRDLEYLARELENQGKAIDHLLYQQQVHVYIIAPAERPNLYKQQTELLEQLKRQNEELCDFISRHA